MKIVLAGGGTGGHFFPLIAIAEELRKIAESERIIELKLYYVSTEPYDKVALFENGIIFKKISAGKSRTYSSFLNFTDKFKTLSGILGAIVTLFTIYPDVVVSKGGYASFPTLVAARILRIPVVIHESDTHPGRVNMWSGKFAKRIGLGFPEAAQFFPESKIALVGQPIRNDILIPAKDGAYEYLKLDPSIPVIVVIGGSTGAEALNDAIIETLPELLSKYQIIHQVGKKNEKEMQSRVDLVLESNPNKDRYKVFGFLNPLATKMCAGVAKLYISRAGASSIGEISAWGIPSILIPLPESVDHAGHQRTNAYSYARHGGAIVMEQANLSHTILKAEIDRILSDETLWTKMATAAKSASVTTGANSMAKEIISLGLSHEK